MNSESSYFAFKTVVWVCLLLIGKSSITRHALYGIDYYISSEKVNHFLNYPWKYDEDEFKFKILITIIGFY